MGAEMTHGQVTHHDDTLKENENQKSKFDIDSIILDSAKRMISFRKELNLYFPKLTFHDEAWDVLLELFVSTAQNEELCVKQVLLSTGMPATSAVRLLERLEGAGLIIRSRSASDRRQTIVSFTENGFESTTSMLITFAKLFGTME